MSKEAKIVGVSVHDPFGLGPVSLKSSILFGGGPTWTAKFFEELGKAIEKLKSKFEFKVVAGGPGAWELQWDRPSCIDVIFIGHAELDLLPLVEKLVEGGEAPSVVVSRDPKADQIPPIVRLGEVQITRGCPRGCWFCSITPETFVSMPVEYVVSEVQVNLKAGIQRVEFVIDDVMLYGSERLKVNHNALVRLFSEVMSMSADGIWFLHISARPSDGARPPSRPSPTLFATARIEQ